MRRVMMAPGPVLSHYRPFITIGKELIARGHEVAAIAMCDLPNFPKLGISTFRVPLDPVEAGPGRSAIIRDHRAVLEWNRKLRTEDIAVGVPHIARAIGEFRPDVMLVDGQAWGAFFAAHEHQVPAATLSTNLMLHLWQYESPLAEICRELLPECTDLFASHGMTGASFRGWEYVSPSLNVTLATEALLGGEPAAPNGLLGGPLVAPIMPGEGLETFPWDRLRDDRPIIYVAFGALIYHQPELIRLLAQAAAQIGVQCVVACGELADTDLAAAIPEAVCVPFAPQPVLLERMQLAVSHGGANTIMECCLHGVPMLVLPLTSDGFANADLIHRKRFGLSLTPATLTVASAAEAMQRLLDPAEGFAERMSVVRASYREQPMGAAIADRLLAL